MLIYFKNTYLVCSFLFLTYTAIPYFKISDMDIINIGFPLSMFFGNVSVRNRETEGSLYLVMAVLTTYFANLLKYKMEKNSHGSMLENKKIIIALIMQIFSLLTYYYKSPLTGCVVMGALFCKLAVEANYRLNKFNDIVGYFDKSMYLSNNEINKHLVIWIQLKIIYILTSYFEFLSLYKFGFHVILALLYVPQVFVTLINTYVIGETINNFNKIVCVICMTILVISHTMFLIKASIIVSVLVSTFMMYENHNYIIFGIVDIVFVTSILNNFFY